MLSLPDGDGIELEVCAPAEKRDRRNVIDRKRVKLAMEFVLET